MEQFIQTILQTLQSTVQNNNYIISICASMLLIMLESMLPMLPLALFIAVNLIVFGNFIGFLISWSATIMGCSISFLLFRFLKKNLFHVHSKQFMWINQINQISFSTLVIILSIPFTPAFSVNIGAGLSNMKFSKYLFALFISKLFLVYFWGFIGTTILESFTDIQVLWKLATMILLAFLLSKWTKHYFCIQ